MSQLLATATYFLKISQSTLPDTVDKLLTVSNTEENRHQVLAQNLLSLCVQTAKCLDLVACFIASVGTCAKVIKQTATRYPGGTAKFVARSICLMQGTVLE